MELQPQAGPQWKFCSTFADIAIFGGAAGGGKTYGSILDVLRYLSTPGYSCAFFRRTYPELTAPDGLWDLARTFFPAFGGVGRENAHDWRFPAGSRVVMSHLQRDADRFRHQGAQYCGIYYDELTAFSEVQFWYLLSRNRSTCGVRPYVRATCNPDPDSFVAPLIAWWLDSDGYPISDRDGVLRWFVRDGDSLVWADDSETLRTQYPASEPLSLTFISARLDDNPALTSKDPSYAARLDALQYVDRMRLKTGNWAVRYAAGTLFRSHWFRIFDEIPGTVQASVRAWDKGATVPHAGNRDPDWTRGILVHRLADGAPVKYLIADVCSLRSTPREIDRAMLVLAGQDGRATTIALWEDPGQAGKVDISGARRLLDGYSVRAIRAARDKITYAKPLSSAAEGGLVGMLRSPWNRDYLAEMEGFPDARHDDQVDASSLAHRVLASVGGVRAVASGHAGGSLWQR